MNRRENGRYFCKGDHAFRLEDMEMNRPEVVGSVIYQGKIVTALSEGKEINYILHITLWLTAMIYVPQIIQSIFSSIATILSVSSVIIIQDWFIILITIVTLVIGLLLGTIRNKMAYTKHEESIKPYRILAYSILAYIRRVFYEKENASDIKNTNISVKLIKMFEDTYNEIFNIIKKYSIKFAWNNSATFILNAIAQITNYNVFKLLHNDKRYPNRWVCGANCCFGGS